MALKHEYILVHESTLDADIKIAINAVLATLGTVTKVDMRYTEGIDQGDQQIAISIVGNDSQGSSYDCSFIRFFKNTAAATIEAGIEADIAAATGTTLADYDVDFDSNVDTGSQRAAFLTVLS